MHTCLQRAVRKGDWHNPFSTLRFLNPYVGGSCFWLSPLLQFLHKRLNSVRVLQVTLLVIMFGLYLPDALAHDPAMHFHRLRRRMSLLLLMHSPQQDWCHIWVQRYWSYLGHVLRQPQSNIARKTVLALCTVTAAVRGPWSHLMAWVLHQTRLCGLGTTPEERLAVAVNRATWFSLGDQVRSLYQLQNPIVHMRDLSRWRDALRVQTAWHVGASLHVQTTDDSQLQITLGWIHEIHGMQCFVRAGGVISVMRLWLQYLQLECAGLSVDIFLERWVFEAYVMELMFFHNQVISEFSKRCQFACSPCCRLEECVCWLDQAAGQQGLLQWSLSLKRLRENACGIHDSRIQN